MAEPVATSLRDVHHLFESAFNAADVDGLLALYEPGAVLGSAPGQEPARGRDQIRGSIINFLAGGANIHLETVQVMEAAGLGLLRGKWLISGASMDGQPFVLSGVSAEVLRRQPDGRWLFVIDNPFAGA
jgi:ketosteroid isomerase-like protein